jgi:molybdenum cofactor cytidylyltransferase
MRIESLPRALGLEEGPHVAAFAGAGGKTTLILRLAAELRAAGRRVAVTCTTKMRDSEALPGSRIVLSGDAGTLAEGMADAFRAGEVPFLFAGEAGPGKRRGLPPETVDALAARADALLVEADGSRGIPLKVPRAREPVVPESCDRHVVVLGAGALGKTAGEATVFNLEGARGFVSAGQPITPPVVAAMLHAPGGFLRFARPGRETVFVVNQCDASDPEEVDALAGLLGHGAVDRILSGSAADAAGGFRVHDNRDHRVAAIVLAAGESRRFGSNKMVFPVGGRPLVGRAARAALEGGADRVFVVTGHEEEALRRTLAGVAGLAFVSCPRYREGMSASIRAGLDAAEGFDAAAILLGDMPFVGPELVARVLREYRACTAPLCFPRAGERPGHPVLFRCDLWEDLRAVRGDEGGRSVVARHAPRARTFPLEDGRSQEDLDQEPETREAP